MASPLSCAWVGLIASLAFVHCQRPAAIASHAADAGPLAVDARTGQDAPPVDASKVITRLRYGRMTPSSDVDLTCTHDGAANATYFNPGFSSHGGEVVPMKKTLSPSRVDEL